MITAALLDAAPIGSRVVFDWAEMPWIRTVYRKVTDGWLNTMTAGQHPVGKVLPSPAWVIALTWCSGPGRATILPPRCAAPVEVWSWSGALGAPHYSWSCRICSDFDVYFFDSSEAHDEARSHAALHAEVTAP